MGFTFINKLPTPAEIREQFPLDQKLAQIKQQRDEDVKKVFTGESDKFIVIIGPCSAAVSYTHLDVYKRQMPQRK